MTTINVPRETLVQVLDAMFQRGVPTDVEHPFRILVTELESLLDALDPFEKYLKEGETPIQRLEREIKDCHALMTVYGHALTQIQELQQQQDTPVAFYEICHDEDGDIEYEFSVYPRPGFRPLYAQSKAQRAP